MTFDFLGDLATARSRGLCGVCRVGACTLTSTKGYISDCLVALLVSVVAVVGSVCSISNEEALAAYIHKSNVGFRLRAVAEKSGFLSSSIRHINTSTEAGILSNISSLITRLIVSTIAN